MLLPRITNVRHDGGTQATEHATPPAPGSPFVRLSRSEPTPVRIPSEYLGCGYCVWEAWAEPASKRRSLFGVLPEDEISVRAPNGAALPVAKPASAMVTTINGVDLVTAFGTTLRTLATNIRAKLSVGVKYGAFAGDLRTEFADCAAQSWLYAYSVGSVLVPILSVQLPPPGELRPLLDPRVRDLLEGGGEDAVHALFDEVGTHYVGGVIVGGRLTMHTSTEKTGFDHGQEIQLAAEASYGRLVTGGASASVSEQEKAYSDSSRMRVHGYGGPQMVDWRFLSPEVVQRWISAVYDVPGLCGFMRGEGEGLVPLHRLVSTRARASQVERWCEDHLKKHEEDALGPEHRTLGTGILDLDVRILHTPPAKLEDFTLVPVDLNKRCRGGTPRIWLFHKDGDCREGDAGYVSDLAVTFAPETKGPDWRRIDVDLNEGVGGETIHLWYRKSQDKPPIRHIDVLVDTQQEPDSSWRVIHKDLNKGAGGASLWLAYSYQ